MGLLDVFRRGASKDAIRIRCGMCRVVTDYPAAKADTFVKHSCDSDVLVRARDRAAEEQALDLFVRAFGGGDHGDAERAAARDRLLYEIGEGSIPGLEDLLYRLKYEPAEPFPPPELTARTDGGDGIPRIDWSNFLEMCLHRMKEFAITRRTLDSAADSVKPILQAKLERLKTEELEPIED